MCAEYAPEIYAYLRSLEAGVGYTVRDDFLHHWQDEGCAGGLVSGGPATVQAPAGDALHDHFYYRPDCYNSEQEDAGLGCACIVHTGAGQHHP